MGENAWGKPISFTASNTMTTQLAKLNPFGLGKSTPKNWSSNRIAFINGYKCYIYCLVEKDGEVVRVGSNDGEADYYPLIAEWLISSICRKAFKLISPIYTAVEDVEADVAELLFKLESSRTIAAK